MQIPAGLTARFGKQILSLQKNAPSLLFAGGIAGVTTSTVFACRSTLRLEEVLAKTKSDLELVNGEEATAHPDYSESDRKRDVAVIYGQSVVSLIRLYAPSFVIGALSIAMLTKSHNILQQRNAALMAAYTAIDKGFKQYRERVVAKYGEEQDRDFRYSTERVEIVNEDTGRKKTVTRAAEDENSHTVYERFFDKGSTEWHDDPDYRLHFLHGQQNYWNDILKIRGHVFLNEVYKSLGIDHSKAGAVVGWIYNSDGDNFIDFGIYDGTRQAQRDFVNGREGAILLDFNVDGVIFDKLQGS